MNFKLKLKKTESSLIDKDSIPAIENCFEKGAAYYHDIYNHLYSMVPKLCEFYLGCRFEELYLLNVKIDKGTDILFAQMIDRMIEENYINNNAIAARHLESMVGCEGFQRYDYENYCKNIGFNRVALSNGGTKPVEYIDAANCFLEDDRGNRFVLHIPKPYQLLNISNSNYELILLANGSNPEARDLCSSFMDKSYRFLRESIRSRCCVLNQKGVPVEVENLSWDALKIPAELKRDIRFHVIDFLEHIDEFKAAGVRCSRGIIISGTPGNGKTMLAKILCANVDAAFFMVTPEDFTNGFGDPTIEDLYRTASNYAPAIVLIEDADIFLQKRTFNANSGKLSDFLNIIDGIRQNNGIITILTCNNPELLDEAVKNRPKRFDVIIEFPNPAIEQRREILADKIEKYLCPEDTGLIDEAAERFEGFSGAHLCEFGERLIMAKIYGGKKYIDAEIFDTEISKFGFKPSRRLQPIGIR